MTYSPPRKSTKPTQPPPKETLADTKPAVEAEPVVSESPIVPEEVQLERPHRFITIPNIKSLKQQDKARVVTNSTPEPKIVPRVNKSAPPIERIKIDKFVPSKKQVLQDQHQQQNNRPRPQDQTAASRAKAEPEVAPLPERPEDAPEPRSIKAIAVDEKDMIDKCEGKSFDWFFSLFIEEGKRAINGYSNEFNSSVQLFACISISEYR